MIEFFAYIGIFCTVIIAGCVLIVIGIALQDKYNMHIGQLKNDAWRRGCKDEKSNISQSMRSCGKYEKIKEYEFYADYLDGEINYRDLLDIISRKEKCDT